MKIIHNSITIFLSIESLVIVKKKKVDAQSVWVKKPFMSKTANLIRRQEIEFVFKGAADSIYSNINPHIYVVNQENRSSTR